MEINTVFKNEYFTAEEYIIINDFSSNVNRDCFEIIIVLDGKGIIESDYNSIMLNAGKTILIPADLGIYRIKSDNVIKLLRVTL